MWLCTFFFVFLAIGVLLSCLIPVMADATQGSIVYTRDQLNLRMWRVAGGRPEIPRELRRKYRGCRAGRRSWLPADAGGQELQRKRQEERSVRLWPYVYLQLHVPKLHPIPMGLSQPNFLMMSSQKQIGQWNCPIFVPSPSPPNQSQSNVTWNWLCSTRSFNN